MRQTAIRQVIACFTIIGLLASTACQNGEDAVASSEEAHQAERSANTQHAQIWAPDEGDHLWVFAESKDNLGSGGEFHIYMDSETHPNASASFSRFALGVGGALPEHRHDRTGQRRSPTSSQAKESLAYTWMESRTTCRLRRAMFGTTRPTCGIRSRIQVMSLWYWFSQPSQMRRKGCSHSSEEFRSNQARIPLPCPRKSSRRLPQNTT